VTTATKDNAISRRAISPQHGDTLQRLFQRVGQMSSLPSVAQRVLQVAADKESCAADLLVVVEQDPTLAFRILRTVNSSYFGLSNEIADLKTAIAMLGFVEVRNLALTVYVARMCEDESEYCDFSREKLWQHMVTVGTIARLLAKKSGKADPDEAYMAGLLHDIGLLLIDQYMHKQLCKVIDLVYEGVDTIEAEQRVLTFDHTDLGAYVARQSKFPERIAIAIQHHHQARLFFGSDRELLDIIAIANYLATRQEISSLGMNNVQDPDDRIWQNLGICENELTAIWEELQPTLASAQVLATI